VTAADARIKEYAMPTYRLHYFPESGNSYKLALMLTLCGEKFEPVWTDFGGGITRTEQWRRTVNEMGEIPVLEADGVRLTQTAPILLKLAKQYGRFGGESEQEQSEHEARQADGSAAAHTRMRLRYNPNGLNGFGLVEKRTPFVSR